MVEPPGTELSFVYIRSALTHMMNDNLPVNHKGCNGAHYYLGEIDDCH